MRSLYLFAVLGLLAVSGVRAGDTFDGEVTDDTIPAAKFIEENEAVGPSEDVDTAFVFSEPVDANSHNELQSGKVVKFLMGFRNRGEDDFTVKHSEISFRYPLDFKYYLQNFTHGTYNRRVAPREEVTLDYGFMAQESLAGRPLGLVVNLHYEDSEGRYYISNVFNQTVTILEDESRFNTEAGILFLFFAGAIVGLLLVGQRFLNKLYHKSGIQKKRDHVDSGVVSNEVDYEWIPRELLKEKKSSNTPGNPRPRKAVKKAD